MARQEVLGPNVGELDKFGMQVRALITRCEESADRLSLASASGDEVELPVSFVGFLSEVSGYLEHGQAVAVTPLSRDLTTSQAARLLQVSRPHVVKLADEGILSCRKVGTHRRIALTDVLRYRESHRSDRDAAIGEFIAAGEEAGLPY